MFLCSAGVDKGKGIPKHKEGRTLILKINILSFVLTVLFLCFGLIGTAKAASDSDTSYLEKSRYLHVYLPELKDNKPWNGWKYEEEHGTIFRTLTNRSSTQFTDETLPFLALDS